MKIEYNKLQDRLIIFPENEQEKIILTEFTFYSISMFDEIEGFVIEKGY